MSQSIGYKRDCRLDIMKGIGILLVVFAHVFHKSGIIYQFHMPLFFVISGMLHKYNGSVQLYKYVRTILVPVVSFAFLFFIVTGFLYSYGYGNYKESVLPEICGGGQLVEYIY